MNATLLIYVDFRPSNINLHGFTVVGSAGMNSSLSTPSSKRISSPVTYKTCNITMLNFGTAGQTAKSQFLKLPTGPRYVYVYVGVCKCMYMYMYVNVCI